MLDICSKRDTAGTIRNWYATAVLEQNEDLDCVPIESRFEQCSLDALIKFLRVSIDPLKADVVHLKIHLAIHQEPSKFFEVKCLNYIT